MQPSYRRNRLEAIVAGVIWFVCGCCVVGISYFLGYAQPARSIGGVPHWILWGVFVPWVVFFLIHCWYSLVFMRDDSPEDSQPPTTSRSIDVRSIDVRSIDADIRSREAR
jgi:hypothetical protein